MAKELVFQRELKESVIALGGYAVKLSNRFTIGVPDLGVWLPPFVPLIIECKDLGVVADLFDRTLDVSPKQADTMRRMQGNYGSPVSLIAVHIVHQGCRRCVILMSTATRLNWSYTHSDDRHKTGTRYPCLGTLFRNLGVEQITVSGALG